MHSSVARPDLDEALVSKRESHVRRYRKTLCDIKFQWFIGFGASTYLSTSVLKIEYILYRVILVRRVKGAILSVLKD